MSDFTRVSAAGMQAGIESLAKANRDLQSTLESLKSELQGSLANWDGNAQREYNTVQQRWDQQAIELNNVVQQMTQVLGQISQGYDDNERRVAGRWS
ncbi:type VII secretion system ESX-1 WXG100 family target ESAT-6 [Brooklawnia cerclae]|uniref:ESAT-6-like protein n=1 Tax=Brooklawnia cerclae TaxID=349934 RepID=A0ABX0SP76_9ACTN|nr:WXG100 family type VII secretion target [Brooklawnia cerclae]NIH58567.1 WXG100 family type VII secretion target [Brooklawnia cerclae]